MPFLRKQELPVSNKDIISWYFDDPQYDMNKKIYIDAGDESQSYTGQQALSMIRKLAAGFRFLGLEKGDTVCLHSFNDVSYPIIANGVVAFGGIFSGTNPSYQPFELAHAIKTAGVKCVIAEPDVFERVLGGAKEAGLDTSRIFVFDTPANKNSKPVPDGFRSWRWLLEHGEGDWERFDDEETSKNTTAARMFSSGTTGMPKAAEISHYNFIAQHVIVNNWAQKDYEERRLQPLPMFHVATAPGMHFSPLRNGVTTFMLRRFDLKKWLSAIQHYKITDIPTVPPIVMQVLNSEESANYDLTSIRFAHCGAAPLEKGPQGRFRKLLSANATFHQVWGMTETTCIATMLPYPEDDNTGSVGRQSPNTDLKLVDDDGNDITDYDVRGEMCIRGPTVIRGYLKNAEANEKSFDKDGYFHTGDISYCDRKTQLWYIVDRKKELIKVRGFQVAPPELEGVLVGHPGIAEAAVIGVKLGSKDDEEAPRAYVVKKDNKEGKTLDEDAVKKYIKERMATYKQLTGGVVFLKEVPKNPSGKMLKKDLRDRAAKELGSKL